MAIKLCCDLINMQLLSDLINVLKILKSEYHHQVSPL